MAKVDLDIRGAPFPASRRRGRHRPCHRAPSCATKSARSANASRFCSTGWSSSVITNSRPARSAPALATTLRSRASGLHRHLGRPDEIGRAVDRDRGAPGWRRSSPRCRTRKGSQRSRWTRPAFADRLAKRARFAELRQRTAPAPSSALPVAHRSKPLAVSPVKSMKRRIAASSAGSGSPVHSSMKNFLNSSAIAQPRPG